MHPPAPPPPGNDRDITGTARRATRPPRKRAKRGRLSREARQLTRDLDVARKKRRENWPKGGQSENDTVSQEKRLVELHEDKRDMRRTIYRAAPELEGADVRKHHPGNAR